MSLYSIVVEPASVRRRRPSSTFSKDFSSEAARPNLFIFHIYRRGERIFVFFYFDRIRTLVAIAT